MRTLVLLCVLLLPAVAHADQIDVMPVAGWTWGGTEDFNVDPIRGDIHVDAAPGYGVVVSAYGHLYGAEVAYQYQRSEAVVRVAGFGEIVRVDLGVHYVLLQIMRLYPLGGITPFVMCGVGGQGIALLGSSEWELACSAGGGLRRSFANGGSLRLTVRMLAPIDIVNNGISLGASNKGIVIGGKNSFFQGDVNLGYSHPLWRAR